MCEIYSNHSKSQILKHLVNLKYNKSIKKYLKLIDIISSTDFLKKCYLFIKSNLRNSTFSNNGETWNGINSKRFQKISREIKDGTYQPKSSRVVHIKKKNSKEKKCFVLSSFRDKIIQEGFRSILATIYEPLFSTYSYGFRQNLRTNNIFKQVKSWNDISWLICLNIEKCFDKINIKKLINILSLQIDDQRFFEVINKFFNSKTLDIRFKTNNTNKSVLYSTLLSSILSNIYLNELDNFIESLILEFCKGKQYQQKKEYWRITNLQSSKNEVVSERNRKLKFARKQKIPYTDLKDLNFKRVRYVRYVDNFVIGISGNKKFTKQIMNKVKVFLKTQLYLNVFEDKTVLLSLVYRQVPFLGLLLKPSNTVISQNFKSKEKRARVLKKLKYEFRMVEQGELKKNKSNLKKSILKSLLKDRKYKVLDSDFLNKVSQTIAQEKSINTIFEKTFFVDSSLRLKVFANESNISEDVANNFTFFQKLIDSDLEIISSETQGKFRNESGQEQKIDFSIQIYAMTDQIKQRLKDRGVISKKGKPIAFNSMICESDKTILSLYAFLARGFLNYYSCADNFYKVKSIINYQIRWSMFDTLAKKHKMSFRKLFSVYGREFEYKSDLQDIFPFKLKIANIKKVLFFKHFDVFNQFYLKKTELFFTKCSVDNCFNTNLKIQNVHGLKAQIEKKNFLRVIIQSNKISGWKAYIIAKNCKHIVLCNTYHNIIHADKFIFKEKKIFESNLL